jgi:DNA-binding response OmpR family regulator
LPKRDGFALLRDIRALEPRDVGGLPVIAMTVFTSTTYPDHKIGAGFKACLNKPFNPDDLLEAVQSVLKN